MRYAGSILALVLAAALAAGCGHLAPSGMATPSAPASTAPAAAASTPSAVPASTAPAAAPSAQPRKTPFVRALRQDGGGVFRGYTNAELRAMLATVCSGRAAGESNFKITRGLVTSGVSIDVVAPIVFIAPDYC